MDGMTCRRSLRARNGVAMTAAIALACMAGTATPEETVEVLYATYGDDGGLDVLSSGARLELDLLERFTVGSEIHL